MTALSKFKDGHRKLVETEKALRQHIADETERLTRAGSPLETSNKLPAWEAALKDIRKLRKQAEKSLRGL